MTSRLLFLTALFACVALNVGAAASQGSVGDYPTIQAAIDANPGRPVHLPAGEYRITEPLVLRHDGGGIFGEGTIIQTNDDADGIQVRSL